MLHERVDAPLATSLQCSELKAAISTKGCFVAGTALNLAVRGARVLIEEGTPEMGMLNQEGELWLEHQGEELEIPCRILRVNLDEVIVAFTNPDLSTMVALKGLVNS